MTSAELLKLSQDFIELTSDHSLREAAYPEDEWEKNGGMITVLGYSALWNDNSPEIEIRGSIRDLRKVTQTVKQDSKSREMNIAAHWNKIQRHPYYAYISKDINFKKAKSEFDRLRSQKKSIKLLSEFADFRFVRIVAKHIPFTLFMEESYFKPLYPDSRLLKKANGHINKLLICFDSKVSLSDYSRQIQLQELLKNLQNEIQIAPRKDRYTETQEKRKCLESITLELKLNFNIKSDTIIAAFSDMLEWTADSKTIREITRK